MCIDNVIWNTVVDNHSSLRFLHTVIYYLWRFSSYKNFLLLIFTYHTLHIARKHLTMSCDCLITGTCAWVSIVHASKKKVLIWGRSSSTIKTCTCMYMYYVGGAKVMCIWMMLYDMESGNLLTKRESVWRGSNTRLHRPPSPI